jgi:hypothetical protein
MLHPGLDRVAKAVLQQEGDPYTADQTGAILANHGAVASGMNRIRVRSLRSRS